MSEADRVSLKYVAESTYNTTPVDSPDWKNIGFIGEQFSGTPRTTASQQIRDDRNLSDLAVVGLDVPGGFTFELDMLNYDDFLEAALCGTWAANVLEIGTVDRAFSIEKYFADVDEYIAFTGMRVGSLSLDFTFGQLVSGAIEMAGAGVSTPNASLVGAGSLAGVQMADKVNASGDVSTLKVDGVTASDCYRKIALNVNNNLRAKECIGSAAPSDQRKGRAEISGTIEAYFEDTALYEKVLNNTDASFEWTVGDGTNSQTFLLPRVKLSGPAPQAGSENSDVIQTLEFRALFDATAGTSLRVTKA